MTQADRKIHHIFKLKIQCYQNNHTTQGNLWFCVDMNEYTNYTFVYIYSSGLNEIKFISLLYLKEAL